MLHNKCAYVLVLVICYAAEGFAILLVERSNSTSTPQYNKAELMCNFQSALPVKVTWQFKGQPVQIVENEVYTISYTSNINALVIKNVTLSREGKYTCTGSNSEGSVNGDIQLSVIQTKPKISPLPDVYLKLTANYSITCFSEGIPSATLEWSKQSGFIDGVNVIDDGNGVLRIKSIRDVDQGKYTCTATNPKGKDSKSFQLKVASLTEWIIPERVKDVKAGESFELIANLVSTVSNPKFTWLKDGNMPPRTQSLTTAGSLYTTKLYFDKVNVGDAGTYVVIYTGMTSLQADIKLTVWATPQVVIEEGTEMSIKEGESVSFICRVHAYPAPLVQWKRNSTAILTTTNTSSGAQATKVALPINKVALKDAGFYTCFAGNDQGNGTATIKLSVEASGGSGDGEDDKTILIVVIVVSIIVIILILLIVFLYIKYRDVLCGQYNSANGTFYTDLVQEEKDASCLADIENNPYAIKKNINISMRGDRSGSVSANGRLFSNTGKGMSLRNTLKMSGKGPTSPTAESNYAPLDSLVCQGKSIDFKHIVFDEILGTGEYGLINGGRVIDDEDPTVYKEVSIKMLKDDFSPSEKRDILEELRMMRRIAKHANVIAFVGWCITDDNVYVLEEYSPFGSLLTFLRTHRSLRQSTESLDQLALEDRVDQKTMLSFAWQIAAGMQHLAASQIIHRDLACRNVYLCHEKTCKISEYGLARDIYAENVYRKTTGGQLPVRWMSYEAVFNGQYTTQSDVWSFGILLWELVTLGKIPYPGIVRTEQLLDELESGYHMENPGHISTDLYLLMNSCWNREPASRPTFDSLHRQLADIMRDADEVHIDLQKLHELEFHDAYDDLKSPTEDFRRPATFKSITEEDGIDNPEVTVDDNSDAPDAITSAIA